MFDGVIDLESKLFEEGRRMAGADAARAMMRRGDIRAVEVEGPLGDAAREGRARGAALAKEVGFCAGWLKRIRESKAWKEEDGKARKLKATVKMWESLRARLENTLSRQHVESEYYQIDEQVPVAFDEAAENTLQRMRQKFIAAVELSGFSLSAANIISEVFCKFIVPLPESTSTSKQQQPSLEW